jgi:hypothetical protein
VYVRLAPLPESAPCVGESTIAYVSGSPSVSVAARGTSAKLSSASTAVFGLATGGSFTGLTVIETVATFEVFAPSLAWNVKKSGPL